MKRHSAVLSRSTTDLTAGALCDRAVCKAVFQGHPMTLNQGQGHHVIGLAILYNMVKVSRFYCNLCPRNIKKSIFFTFQGHQVTLNQGQGRHVICRCKGLAICYNMVMVP